MSETNNKLEIKNLSKRFGEKILFENLSLTVDDPAVLWAPSGWGKTTRAPYPDGAGKRPPPAAWRAWAGCGAVFQEAQALPPA